MQVYQCTNKRQCNQQLWTTDKWKTVTATCAFGMGINKYKFNFAIKVTNKINTLYIYIYDA